MTHPWPPEGVELATGRAAVATVRADRLELHDAHRRRSRRAAAIGRSAVRWLRAHTGPRHAVHRQPRHRVRRVDVLDLVARLRLDVLPDDGVPRAARDRRTDLHGRGDLDDQRPRPAGRRSARRWRCARTTGTSSTSCGSSCSPPSTCCNDDRARVHHPVADRRPAGDRGRSRCWWFVGDGRRRRRSPRPDGRELYVTGCSSCHGVDGTGVTHLERRGRGASTSPRRARHRPTSSCPRDGCRCADSNQPARAQAARLRRRADRRAGRVRRQRSATGRRCRRSISPAPTSPPEASSTGPTARRATARPAPAARSATAQSAPKLDEAEPLQVASRGPVRPGTDAGVRRRRDRPAVAERRRQLRRVPPRSRRPGRRSDRPHGTGAGGFRRARRWGSGRCSPRSPGSARGRERGGHVGEP